ncbi:GNAT family N-acetyltransferase [Leucobacter chinensis]|uniref:GNAT family N-acetyltransferase n=1 Tax=Leucobacter chinensis TaxID=2851010 RepID=UPI001C219333|nr:GNAT family N-acetyltransferase [Leucobacter chinensis]
MVSQSIAQRVGRERDALDAAVETIALAFSGDPTWAPLLVPDPDDLALSTTYWGLFVRSAAERYEMTYAIDGSAAVSVWLPQGGDELSADESAGFEHFATSLLGETGYETLLEIGERFEAAHPTEPHNYLSLLGVHPSRRGEGIGMRLLAENLAHFDALGEPTYLESSNPANDARYLALGFEPHGTIALPSGLTLATMWRDPQAA